MTDRDRKSIYKALARKRRATWCVITFENLVSASWRLTLWCAFFVALWLLSPSVMSGLAVRIGLSLFFWGGVLYFCYRDVRHFRRPTVAQTDLHLERNTALRQRPIEALKDKLANPEHEKTRALWDRYRHNSLDLVRALRIPAPRAYISGADKYALRIAVILFLTIGITAAAPDWRQDIKTGLFPFTARNTNALPLTLWITPPAYTGFDVITIENRKALERDTPLTIPEGSSINARMKARWIKPYLHTDKSKTAFKHEEGENWTLETGLPATEQIRIKQFLLTRYNIPILFKPDTPPTISITQDQKPIILPKGAIQFPLTVKDDYGINSLKMTMTLAPQITDKPIGGTVREERPFSSIAGEDTELMPYYDLTWHPWAGLPVEFTITATDETGQSATLPPVKMTLPERDFEHPLAKALIKMRQSLAWDGESAAHDVAMALEQALPYPDQYQNDPVVFLSMRSMASRLQYAATRENVIGVIAQLWDTALRIEDGNLSLASRKLRDAQQNMQSLLNNENATDEQIAEAMQKLRQAMSEYFRELGREMQKRMAEGSPVPMLPQDMMNSINPDDLAAFLEQLQSESLSGNRSKAMDMLSRLEDMMNTLDPSMSMKMPPDMEFMQDGVNELKELVSKQEALRDQTQRQANMVENSTPQTYGEIIPLDKDVPDLMQGFDLPQPQKTMKLPESKKSKKPTINTEAHKAEQDSLRYILGQLMLEADEKLGAIPENMQSAEQEMRQSGEQLGANAPALSVPHQNNAIAHLKKAQQKMNQQLIAMMKQMQMMNFGPGKTDPFGRPIQQGNGSSWLQNDKVKVPDKTERKRAQEILRELRDRAGDRSRPDYELDYYNRLMNQF